MMRNAFGLYLRGAIALASLITALALVSGPARASAQEGAGAFRLGADVNIIAVRDFPDFANNFTFGFGPAGAALGPSIGFQLVDWLVLGGRVELRFDWTDRGAVGTTDLNYDGTFAVVPYAEFLLTRGDARFYVGPEVGFEYLWNGYDGTFDYFEFRIGPIAGVHIFVTDSFSITPNVAVDLLYFDNAGGYAGVQFLANISFEGWLGGTPEGTVEQQQPVQQQQPVYQYQQGY
jgi:hypothetical protein